MKPNLKSRLSPSQNSRAVANQTQESKSEDTGIPQVSKLKVGSPDDAFEKEADHMAEQVVNGQSTVQNSSAFSSESIFRKGEEEEAKTKPETAQCAQEEEAQTKPESIQRMEGEEEAQSKADESEVQKKEAEEEAKMKADTNSSPQKASAHTSLGVKKSRGNGSPLPAQTRVFMESRFGADLSKVRVHTGDKAEKFSADLKAQAFTVGNDIFFNKDKFNPDSQSGKTLLAHELTHTLQQKGKSPIKKT